MARHIVKVVEDDTLAADDGWAMVHAEDTGDIYFLVEQSRASDEEVLTAAWTAANRLQRNIDLRRAVLDGHRGVG